MIEISADAVLAGINRVLADGGADAEAVNMRVTASEEGYIASFDTAADDPRIAIVPRITIALTADEAAVVASARRYTAPRVLVRTEGGVILSVGVALPAGLGLEIDEIVEAAARTRSDD